MPAKNDSAAPPAASAQSPAMIEPMTSVDTPAMLSPNPNFRPHRPITKLPSVELPIVISRKTRLRFGLLTACMARVPSEPGFLAGFALKTISEDRSDFTRLGLWATNAQLSSELFSSLRVGIETM
jgi:hypothetical protein